MTINFSVRSVQGHVLKTEIVKEQYLEMHSPKILHIQSDFFRGKLNEDLATQAITNITHTVTHFVSNLLLSFQVFIIFWSTDFVQVLLTTLSALEVNIWRIFHEQQRRDDQSKALIKSIVIFPHSIKMQQIEINDLYTE